MATERLIIEDRHVARAQKMAEANSASDGKTYIFTDMKTTGLSLRIQGATAAWIVRYKNFTKTIGYAFPRNSDNYITTLSKVRELATASIALLKNGDEKQLKSFLSEFYVVKSSNREKNERYNVKSALETMKRVNTVETWTLRQCVDQVISDKSSDGSKFKLRPTSIKDYKTTFNRAAFQEILQKPACKIEQKDIEAVRDTVRETSGISSANKIISYSKSVLDYCAKHHGGLAGLDPARPWWRMLSSQWQVKPKTRRPTVENIVKSLLLAEKYTSEPLPGRIQNSAGVRRKTLMALWWLVLTCQRGGAGLSLRLHDIAPDADENFYLAAWAENVMKSDTVHILPIPSRAWLFVSRFQTEFDRSSNEIWVFPSEKTSKKHVSSSGVYRILYRLAARDALIQVDSGKVKRETESLEHDVRPARRDLFAENEIDWWSAHDLRRTLTSCLDDAGIPGGASVILAHDIHDKQILAENASDIEKADFQKIRTARITKIAYGGAQYMNLKRQAMKIWTDTILDEYDRQKAIAVVN